MGGPTRIFRRREVGEPAPVTARPVSESLSMVSQVMLPNDANPLGNVHGGAIMKMVDMGAAVAAMRHSRRQVVTVALEHMSFLEPAYIGDLITITSKVEYVGRTSMLVRYSEASVATFKLRREREKPEQEQSAEAQSGEGDERRGAEPA